MTPVALAERIIALFAEGSFSATYKHAVLLALLDLCFEKTSHTGVPPTSITTRELAEEVLGLYWPQCVPWERGRYLRQGGGSREQAEILSEIIEVRQGLGRADSLPLAAVRRDSPAAYERLVHSVEWKLIEMPIPRLQVLGRSEDRFLYEYQWDKSIKKSAVAAYQRGAASGFSNVLTLKPGVAEGLIAVNGLLRPLIRREWLRLIQLFNNEPEARLERFLFDRDREALAAVRDPLTELQDRRCFFCDGAMKGQREVDHFIPWARFPNNALENLVVAHHRCNNAKRDFLACGEHVARWSSHIVGQRAALLELSTSTTFESALGRSQGIAAATYLQMPVGAQLWVEGSRFVPLDRPTLVRALRAA